MQRLRVYARVARVLLVVLFGLGMAALFSLYERLRVPASIERRQRWSQLFMNTLSNALPFKVRVVGKLPQQPMLWVSNHVSWTDIPLLGRLAPLSFLSKAEVRTWPVAGWLALKAGTLFIRRGGNDSQLLRKQISQHLQQDCALLIFPEGTTTDGRSLRTFHGRLLASAIDTQTPLQPVALRYLRNGQSDSIAPFIGDDDLLSHLFRLFANDCAEVEIHLLAPIASTGEERAALAFKAQHAIQLALFGSEPVVQAQRRAKAA
ncbi:lysophospholipid acyltransferase family protein [Pseudomonas rubra]|uniref:1-acyl-sn-glycerol-3-phosphate acyltransferase n=1 Tax=Pseudomonas rubra TaxID=2942627 RepID=A0ABT5PAS1_9PSED|nr:lysophospholipid acyltransferase family protein [Pseudomonas rubra]MDD1015325.1 1-acyl-sn-glycerol-3-phosphate acyltransferase [Pseudomonas rubra]MDD1039547.1 1-acyl-sn-glycerol-3-phosphate acyltransferase [Pseudomonas rubra]MDD1154027.1 1-acyl-sn-glycerol-3-phosphate acyltransferase [Pseudomonas rubra]